METRKVTLTTGIKVDSKDSNKCGQVSSQYGHPDSCPFLHRAAYSCLLFHELMFKGNRCQKCLNSEV